MLSVRNVILAASLLLVLSIATSVGTMLRTPNSGGMANDTYGTHGGGYQGLFDVLDELDIDVTRGLAPPDAPSTQTATLALLSPHQRLVGFEPSYLQRIQPWVKQGGRLVVAPSSAFDPMLEAMATDSDDPPPTLLEAIGVWEAELSYIGSSPQARWERQTSHDRDVDEIARNIIDNFTSLPALRDVSVDVDPRMAVMVGDFSQLTIPDESVATLLIDETAIPSGTVTWTDENEVTHTLVATFERGDGEIVVISDPKLLSNRLISRSDNSVLAVRLLSPEGKAVLFDEFYHGVGVRGQPLYLLTRFEYATLTMGLLLFLGLWIWRKGIFLGPPLADQEVTRRDISHYVDAMGKFFAEGASGRGWLVKEVRDGVLRQISDDLGLPPDIGDVERIAAVVARRDIRHGELLIEVTRSVDAELQTRRYWSESQTLNAMQRMTDCLLKNDTTPSGQNLRKLSSDRKT